MTSAQQERNWGRGWIMARDYPGTGKKNDEYRMSNVERSTNDECRKLGSAANRSFV